MSTTSDRIDAAVAAADFGTASAAKRGRDPRWQYVPVVVLPESVQMGYGSARTRQVMGLAYATREEAVAAAERHLAAERALVARKLADRRYRALRLQYGLPYELEDVS